MAKPTTYKGSLVAIYLEESGSPAGVFSKPCGLNNHTLTFSKGMQEINVPDCDDPEAAQWVERDVENLDFGGSGEGVLAAESIQRWWDAFNSTVSINSRVYVGAIDDAVNGYYWSGKLHVSNFEVQGQTGQRALVTIQVASDGEMTFTPVS